MKTSFFVLGAAALLLTSGAARAAPERPLQSFLDRAEAQAQSLAVAAGCNLDAQAIQVRAYIGPEGRLKSVQVVGSSGSRDTDRAVEQSLRHLQLENVPDQLIDAKLTFFLGHAGAAPAKLP